MQVLILWRYYTVVESKDFGFSSFIDVLLQVRSQAEASSLFRNMIVALLIREIETVLR